MYYIIHDFLMKINKLYYNVLESGVEPNINKLATCHP